MKFLHCFRVFSFCFVLATESSEKYIQHLPSYVRYFPIFSNLPDELVKLVSVVFDKKNNVRPVPFVSKYRQLSMSYFNAIWESFTGFSGYHFVQSTIHWIDLRVQTLFLFRDPTLFYTQIDTYMYVLVHGQYRKQPSPSQAVLYVHKVAML